MTDARSRILDRLRKRSPSDAVLPQPLEDPTTYTDPVDQFRQTLEFVGGRLITAPHVAAAAVQLRELPIVHDAKCVYSQLPEIAVTSPRVAQAEFPHEMRSVDLAIVSGEFWVAENAAIWITDEHLQHRVVLFLAQHLVLVVRRSTGVHHMHHAYDRIGQIQRPFGVFISGPSKTADIEQSLVIGAHGARSLHVVMLDS